MCSVVCVKISSDEHGFAVRIHKPLAFAMRVEDSAMLRCSRWVIFASDAAAMQNRFSGSPARSAETQGSPAQCGLF